MDWTKEERRQLEKERQELRNAIEQEVLAARKSEEIIDHLFSQHTPDEHQKIHFDAIREAAKYFAKVIWQHTPDCQDRKIAIRILRQCVMTTNTAIALKGVTL